MDENCIKKSLTEAGIIKNTGEVPANNNELSSGESINLDKPQSTFNFYANKTNDLKFFNSISQEITKIGTPPVQYKCIRIDDTRIDDVFGDSPNPVYDPAVEVYISYVPQQIILELLQFGLSATNEDLNVLVNKQHFEKATNKNEPQNGDKIMDSRGKIYKVQNVVRDMDNVFFGDTMHYALTLKLTEEEF
jgi:hypothetical protein